MDAASQVMPRQGASVKRRVAMSLKNRIAWMKHRLIQDSFSRISFHSIRATLTAIRGGMFAAILAAISGQCGGEEIGRYPTKAIKIVVPFSAGSIVDVRARQIGERLAKVLAQPIVIDNRPGATTIIGAELVAKAKPDGYTILMTSSGTFMVTPSMVKTLPFDPIKDFQPITRYSSGTLVLVAHPSLGVSTVKELIALAKAKPGKLNYASPGAGTNAAIAAEIFKRVAGIDIEGVIYKSEAPALTDVVAGHVPLIFSFPLTSGPYIQEGKLKALMQTGHKRLKVLPQVPTAEEVGLPDASLVVWGGFWAPAGTPAPIVKRLSTALAEVIMSPDMRQLMEGSGSEVHASTPEEFSAFLAEERIKWAKIISTLGIRAEE